MSRLQSRTLKKLGLALPKKCHTPLDQKYHPELEVTAELKSDGIQRYQEFIGILRWAVKLGRVDILLEVLLMSTYLAMPRVGHLNQLYRIFGYLREHPKRKLIFRPDHPKISEQAFKKCDWTDFYRDAHEAIPDDMPKPRINSCLRTVSLMQIMQVTMQQGGLSLGSLSSATRHQLYGIVGGRTRWKQAPSGANSRP